MRRSAYAVMRIFHWRRLRENTGKLPRSLRPSGGTSTLESTVPSEKITEQSRLADWLFNQLYNVNVTSMFNSQVRKKLLDEVHALAYISEPMYEACFSFYLRLNCSVANVVNLLSFAHSASLVTQGEFALAQGKWPEAEARFNEANRIFPGHWRTPGVVEMGRDLSPGPALPLDSPPIGGMETG